ncbi:M16 family metallopeptidase [Lewinella sp. IMCC34183]|uniref:M16 family metallopeptidase n=1 Tax=Lewinella sp. IMCC34183 TaxID=2248762 RepID=UPI000E275777|nr:pitrilysin family protein [Lewinella sp. IMCC34183]
MQRITYSLAALLILLITACGTPKSTASTGTPTAPAAPPATETAEEVLEQDFRATAPEPGPAPEINLGDFEDFTLDNGLQVVLVENHKLPRVSYQLFVDVPPHLEGAYAGTQDMLGSMLRRATSDMSKEEIDEAVDFIGANLSTSGSGAYASTISKYKEEVMQLMADVILNAEFPAEEFAKVKEDARAGLAQQLSSPDAIASRVRQAITYGPNHPYGELMTESTLDSITLDVVKEAYNTYFVPNRSYLVMVGDLTPAEARSLATEHFSDWERKEVAVPEFPTPQIPDGVTVNFVPRPGAVQSNVIFTDPIQLQPGTKESIRANLLNIALGSGFNGRLFANLREDKGYTYGAYSSIGEDKLVGNFRAYANVRNEVTDSAITQFIYELDRIAAEPLTATELDNAKMQIAGSFGRALESPQRIAGYALNTIRYDLDRDFYPDYLQVVQNSSLNDVSEVAREIVTPENINIVVVGDPAEAEKLARFATSGEVTYYDANGAEVDVEGMEAPADLTVEQVLNGYLEAIGGKAAAEAIENLSVTFEGSLQGQTLTQKMVTTNDNRMSSQTMMSGMTVADQRYANGKAMVKQMGQPMELPDEAVTAMAEQAVIFPELSYLDRIDDITIEGTEMIDGKPAVVLVIGEGLRESYDAESMLKVRTTRQQGPQTIKQTLSDYEPIEGVLFPRTMVLEGMLPVPLTLKVTEIAVNEDLDEEMFSVE